jgi:hypothetical protein
MLSDEESKAIQEMAKTAGKSVEAAQKLGGFIAKYIGGPLEQAIGIWHDKLKYRRWENQVLLLQKATMFLQARGLSAPTRSLNLALAIPLLEEASLADSEVLQDRWATLLANAGDASQPEVRRAYVSILAELTAFDAMILEKVYDADSVYIPTEARPYASVWTAELPDRVIAAEMVERDIKPPKVRTDVAVALVNLARLGLIDCDSAFGGLSTVYWVVMTELGRQFVVACRPNT